MLRGVAAAINAGGRGMRMGGVNKALIEVGGLPLIERQLRVLGPLFGELMVVSNAPADFAPWPVRVVPDPLAGQGPLAGLRAALAAAEADRVFLIACDMPFPDERAVRLVVRAARGADAAVPVAGGRPEPLFACYARACLPAVDRAIADGRLKMTAFLDEVRARFVPEPALRAIDPELRFLRNINEPGD